jgi:hypothetical protein
MDIREVLLWKNLVAEVSAGVMTSSVFAIWSEIWGFHAGKYEYYGLLRYDIL